MLSVILLILSLSIILSISMTIYSHPISILIVILLQTSIICVMIWILTKSSWFSFILFLIFLGGLMVLFLYITSLASNEIFSMSTYNNTLILLISLTLILFFMYNFHFIKSPNTNFLPIASLMKIVFSTNMMWPTILIMTYLFFVLIVAVKVASKIEGPIRNLI